MSESKTIESSTPEETFSIAEEFGTGLAGGEVLLLTGGLGAGKTLFTKGVVSSLGFDVDEVTSPSFTLVNLYKTPDFDVYHIDLWRSDSSGDNAAFAVGLDEILEDDRAIVIIEWAERLGDFGFRERKVYRIKIAGDGDDVRRIEIKQTEQIPAANV
jgi:tRNA threonylcarbamoyladenosine biosynthesis protein TsaE